MKRTVTATCAAAMVCACFAAEEVRVSQFGYDAEDSTKAVQAALDSGARRIVFDNDRGPWIVRPVFARSNQELVFEDGAELQAKRGEFKGTHDFLLYLHNVSNVTIRGLGAKGGTLRMHKKDYQNPPYAKSEWRHTMRICSCQDVLVENMHFVSSGGDGVCISTVGGARSERIVVRRCVCDDNHRQGISVAGVWNLLIEDCVFKNTSGTAPSAGIDIEPDRWVQSQVNNVIRNCEFDNNAGGGLEMNINNLDGRSEPISITVENCRMTRSKGSGILINGNHNMTAGPLKGRIRIKGCQVEDSRTLSLVVFNSPKSAFRVDVEDCTFSRGGCGWLSADVAFASSDPLGAPLDGISLKNVKVVQSGSPHPWFAYSHMPLSEIRADDVTGDVTVTDVHGVTTKHELDDAWRRRELPQPLAKPLPKRLELSSDLANLKVADACPGEMVDLAPIHLMTAFRCVFFADRPGPVRFRARQTRRMAAADAPLTRPIRVKGIGLGVEGTMPMPGTNSQEIVFDAPKRGLYAFDLRTARCNLLLEACDAPVGIDLRQGRQLLDTVGRPYSIWFRPTAGSQFALLVSGADRNHSCKVRVVDPSGKAAFADDRVFNWRSFCAEAPEDGLWRLDVSQAEGLPLRMMLLDLLGTQPVMFLSREKTWTW